MGTPGHPLFRKEVLAAREGRLDGDVMIAVPASWQFVGYFLLAVLIAVAAFFLTATYARVETVSGTIVLDKGAASIVPSRRGVVTGLGVREGQRVRAGQLLAMIRSEDQTMAGQTGSHREIAALVEQDEGLADQAGLMLNAAAADRARLMAEIQGARGELASLGTQIAAQRRLIEVAADEFERTQTVAARGFISRHDVNAKEAVLISRRQQLAQLEQTRAAKTADLAEAERQIARLAAATQADTAGARANRAGLRRQRAQAEAASGYRLVSPVAGRVTALTARLGQPADAESSLMVVVPAGARPRAELYVPTASAGFLEIGQEVRLSVDAFPYQRFGTLRATITEISSIAVPRPGPAGSTVSIYLVTADLDRNSIVAFGRRQPLLPGMALSGRIVGERQSLFRWLFEPLFAVGNR